MNTFTGRCPGSRRVSTEQADYKKDQFPPPPHSLTTFFSLLLLTLSAHLALSATLWLRAGTLLPETPVLPYVDCVVSTIIRQRNAFSLRISQYWVFGYSIAKQIRPMDNVY